MTDKILIIDNGSYKCRVGFSDSEKPLFEFRNLIAKPRKDKKKDAPSVVENAFQIGDEIDVDAMRLLLKTQFERNVVTHPVYQEHIFDYILGRITPEGQEWEPQPILITEALANPTYCRQTMNELFFECYGVPSLCYGIDSALAWQHNRSASEENSLIVNFGYHTTHVVPILRGHLQHDKIRRLNLGGYQMISYLYRLLQMKYPAHLNAISWTRMEDIFHNHSSVAVDYLGELRKWDNLEYYNAQVKKIQLPYTAPVAPNPLAAEEKLKRRKEMAKRLIEANQKRLREKKGEEQSSDAPVPTTTTTTSTSSRSAKYQPPPNVPLQTWLEEIKKKHSDIIEKKSSRQKRRQEMVKRHTLASQERMRIISLLASHDKGSDEFGKDDKDWDVYKKISHENESDSDAENEKLMEYEGIMKYHQASMAKDSESIENTAELYQLHVGVESLRAPELLFQPSMIGMYETGVAELLKFVFDNFAPEDQQTLADNVFITGGCSQLPGLKSRLVKELQEMRPFQSSFSIKESKNALLDAWFGGKDLANSSHWTSCLTTKADYMEKGTDYFKDYPTSNKYLITPQKCGE
ncbi:actin-related protein 5 [Musca autumnalis]|uniref:actin-related protein 5 n=1 Tax=Musca autumnalis TaxID=221902 RepID=UPI003CF11F52